MYIRPNFEEIDQPVEGDQAYPSTVVTEEQSSSDEVDMEGVARLPDGHRKVYYQVILDRYR